MSIDYEQLCNEKLIELRDQEIAIENLKNRINGLTKKNVVRPKEEVTPKVVFPKEVEEETEEDSFEDEVNYYLNSYRLLSDNFTEEEIKSILPKKKNSRFKDILLRLALESVKEIKDIEELLRTEDLSSKEKESFEAMIASERRKIDYIKSRLVKSETEEKDDEEEEKNTIILVPTIGGNIRIIDELEHIPNDYYAGFKKLIDSIVDGTFKNVKSFTNHPVLSGDISEVKLFKIRVVFTRLSSNTYALLTAFVKKSNSDKLYHESLVNKVKDYYGVESKLVAALGSEEFLEENSKNVRQLYSIISTPEDVKKRGV